MKNKIEHPLVEFRRAVGIAIDGREWSQARLAKEIRETADSGQMSVSNAFLYQIENYKASMPVRLSTHLQTAFGVWIAPGWHGGEKKPKARVGFTLEGPREAFGSDWERFESQSKVIAKSRCLFFGRDGIRTIDDMQKACDELQAQTPALKKWRDVVVFPHLVEPPRYTPDSYGRFDKLRTGVGDTSRHNYLSGSMVQSNANRSAAYGGNVPGISQAESIADVIMRVGAAHDEAHNGKPSIVSYVWKNLAETACDYLLESGEKFDESLRGSYDHCISSFDELFPRMGVNELSQLRRLHGIVELNGIQDAAQLLEQVVLTHQMRNPDSYTDKDVSGLIREVIPGGNPLTNARIRSGLRFGDFVRKGMPAPAWQWLCRVADFGDVGH